MIVQSARDNRTHFVMTMDQHTSFAAQLAECFGNEQFEPINPRDQMLHVVRHHDAGWQRLDDLVLRDGNTGLPYNLGQTPFEKIIETSQLSPDFNGEAHPYCELISSMHSLGLYNGRYGMSDKVLLDALGDENRELIDIILLKEKARQKLLKIQLIKNSETAAWIEEKHLFQNYKQLQFFDTLALYFNCSSEGTREENSFLHVPKSKEKDVTISIQSIGSNKYQLRPYPFNTSHIELSFYGRYMSPTNEGYLLRKVWQETPVESQTICLVTA
jgi:hypothetical protein